MTINKTNTLNYNNEQLKKLNFIDSFSFKLGKILTSTILIIIVLLTFLMGVAVHLKDVFDSWFLAIGLQAVVLISSVNSDILPTVKIGKNKTLTLIPMIMSILMCWYLFINFKGLTFEQYSLEWWTALTKAFGVAVTEYMFSYLFTFRYNKFISDLSELSNTTSQTPTQQVRQKQAQKII